MIGTHNSGTGEKGSGWLSKLVTPFAKCQTKTLKEQYWAGCRFFDLRVKNVGGKLVLAHGLWHSDVTLWNAISLLHNLAKQDMERCVNVIVTYEGRLDEENIPHFIASIQNFSRFYTRVNVGYIAVKKPTWKTVWAGQCPHNIQGFQSLEHAPYCLLPIPWVWNLWKHDETEGKEFVMVDFL